MTILGSITPERFLAEYWQKRPLLVRGAFPGFASPMTPEELAGLALEPDVETRVIVERRGRFVLHRAPLTEETFEGMPAKRWTFLVQAVDQSVPAVAALKRHFRFVPDWRVDDVMISYAAPEGSVGPHYDNYDVFLLQGLGRRRWLVGDACGPDTPLVDNPDLRLIEDFQPREDWVLEPGDMLYLPPRVAHHGIALDRCMTYSIGFRAPAVADLLDRLAEEAGPSLDDADRYADPGMAPPADPAEIDAAALARLRETMIAAMDRPGVLAGLLGRLVTEPKYEHSVVPRRRRMTAAQLLKTGKGLEANAGSRFAWTQDGTGDAEGVRLFVDGEDRGCFTGPAGALARRIAGGEPLPAAEVAAALADPARAELLLALVDGGSLLPA